MYVTLLTFLWSSVHITGFTKGVRENWRKSGEINFLTGHPHPFPRTLVCSFRSLEEEAIKLHDLWIPLLQIGVKKV